MKIIDNYLDGYYARKVVALVKRHVEKDLGLGASAYYDDTLHEWTIDASQKKRQAHTGNDVFISLPFVRFDRCVAPELLTELLVKGWSALDTRYEHLFQRTQGDLQCE